MTQLDVPQALELVRPRSLEVVRFMHETVQHVCHVEGYDAKTGWGESDPERPHDLIGEGNKFSLHVIEGLALQYINEKGEHWKQIKDAVEAHRLGQRHHQRYNFPNPQATTKDMLFGATDGLCAGREPRSYQRSLSWDEIAASMPRQKEHQRRALQEAMNTLRTLERPPIERIISLRNIPNIGIPASIHRGIVDRVEETLCMLRERGYHDIDDVATRYTAQTIIKDS